MRLFRIQDGERPAYVIARDMQDAISRWEEVVKKEQDLDSCLPPDGVHFVCDADELIAIDELDHVRFVRAATAILGQLAQYADSYADRGQPMQVDETGRKWWPEAFELRESLKPYGPVPGQIVEEKICTLTRVLASIETTLTKLNVGFNFAGGIIHLRNMADPDATYDDTTAIRKVIQRARDGSLNALAMLHLCGYEVESEPAKRIAGIYAGLLSERTRITNGSAWPRPWSLVRDRVMGGPELSHVIAFLGREFPSVGSWSNQCEVQEANGRLIAAAPDLLEVAKACLLREDIADSELGEQLRKVIGQATGEAAE